MSDYEFRKLARNYHFTKTKAQLRSPTEVLLAEQQVDPASGIPADVERGRGGLVFAISRPQSEEVREQIQQEWNEITQPVRAVYDALSQVDADPLLVSLIAQQMHELSLPPGPPAPNPPRVETVIA